MNKNRGSTKEIDVHQALAPTMWWLCTKKILHYGQQAKTQREIATYKSTIDIILPRIDTKFPIRIPRT